MKLHRHPTFCLVAALLGGGCTSHHGILSTDALVLKQVVLYRNGVGYFERSGHVDTDRVSFRMRESELGDFLASLAVMEKGGSSVRSAAFPIPEDPEPTEPAPDDAKPPPPVDRRKLRDVVLTLDGKEHDLEVGYIASSPVWHPTYRLVVRPGGSAELEMWGVVHNVSGEDWNDVSLSLVAGAPLAFETQLGTPVVPQRPTVTDEGEVVDAIPRSETSMASETLATSAAPRPTPSAAPAPSQAEHDSDEEEGAYGRAVEKERPSQLKSDSDKSMRDTSDEPFAPSRMMKKRAAPAPPMQPVLAGKPGFSPPRNVHALAALATQAGSTRYDLPEHVSVPDRSATMVLLVARTVPGEMLFLFAPDERVPSSDNHPFRVARFTNPTGGLLEKGPIAVFQPDAFLGQGLVDPLPDGASTTVPFAIDRSVSVGTEKSHDELGERIARIENGDLVVEHDTVTITKYKMQNGGTAPAKLLIKHPRLANSTLFQPPKGTEDTVGTGTALVPVTLPPHAPSDLAVEERSSFRGGQDWFSYQAEKAVRAFLFNPASDKTTVAKLSPAWAKREEIVKKLESRARLVSERREFQIATQETRSNLGAIEKNKSPSALALRTKLTTRLNELAVSTDNDTRQIVELDTSIAELRIQFREAIKLIKYTAP